MQHYHIEGFGASSQHLTHPLRIYRGHSDNRVDLDLVIKMETTHSSYRERVHSALGRWPELAWLNRFLQTPKPATVEDETAAQIFDLDGTHFTTSGQEASAISLSQALNVEQIGRLRVVLVSHGDSWDVDRDIVDVVCTKYSLDPRFVAKHFDYPKIRFEDNCPRDLFSAIKRVNNSSRNKYTWDLGGEVCSQLSTKVGLCFFFAYEKECLSVALHEEDLNTTRQ